MIFRNVSLFNAFIRLEVFRANIYFQSSHHYFERVTLPLFKEVSCEKREKDYYLKFMEVIS